MSSLMFSRLIFEHYPSLLNVQLHDGQRGGCRDGDVVKSEKASPHLCTV